MKCGHFILWPFWSEPNFRRSVVLWDRSFFHPPRRPNLAVPGRTAYHGATHFLPGLNAMAHHSSAESRNPRWRSAFYIQHRWSTWEVSHALAGLRFIGHSVRNWLGGNCRRCGPSGAADLLILWPALVGTKFWNAKTACSLDYAGRGPFFCPQLPFRLARSTSACPNRKYHPVGVRRRTDDPLRYVGSL
jgi:hypothetical protein